MKKISIIVTLTIILINNNPLYSQLLSLKDCIEIGLKNNVQLHIDKYQKKLTKKDVYKSYSQILPSINFTGTYQKVKIESIYESFYSALLGPPYNSYIALTQNIFDGGYWWNFIKQAHTNDKRQFYTLQEQQNSTIETIEQNYYELLKAKKLYEVYKTAIERSTLQVERSENMRQLGLASIIDVGIAKVGLGTDSIATIQQETIVEMAIHNLNISIGRNPDEPIEITDNYKLIPKLSSIDSLLKIAFNNNPLLLASNENENSARLGVKLVCSNLFPSLSTNIQYSRIGSNKASKLYDDLSNEYTFTYSLSLNFNLFNGFQNIMNIQQAKILASKAREESTLARRNLEKTVRQLYKNYVSLLKIIKINQVSLDVASESYLVALEKYQLGNGSALETREAQLNLTKAEQIFVSAQYDACIIYAQLERQLGTIYKIRKPQNDN